MDDILDSAITTPQNVITNQFNTAITSPQLMSSHVTPANEKHDENSRATGGHDLSNQTNQQPS